jgi:AcrR family transcriptional regulator
LEAAEEVFAAEGLDGAHMSDIAARAGVAVGTLYNHFKDRDALLVGLCQLRGEGLLAALDENLRARKPDFRAQLSALLGEMFGYIREHQRFYTILWQGELGHQSKFTPDVMRALHERLDGLMQRGVQERALRPELGSFYASLLMGLMRGMGIYRTLCNVSPDQQLFDPEQLAEFFMRGAGA